MWSLQAHSKKTLIMVQSCFYTATATLNVSTHYPEDLHAKMQTSKLFNRLKATSFQVYSLFHLWSGWWVPWSKSMSIRSEWAWCWHYYSVFLQLYPSATYYLNQKWLITSETDHLWFSALHGMWKGFTQPCPWTQPVIGGMLPTLDDWVSKGAVPQM